MARNCACAELLARTITDAGFALLPDTTQLIFFQLLALGGAAGTPGHIRFLRPVTQAVSIRFRHPETETQTALETLAELGLIVREADGQGLWLAGAEARHARAESARSNGLRGGRPRKGETREQYLARQQRHLALPIAGGRVETQRTEEKPMPESSRATSSSLSASEERGPREAMAEVVQLAEELAEVARFNPATGLHNARPIQAWLAQGASPELLREVFARVVARPGYAGAQGHRLRLFRAGGDGGARRPAAGAGARRHHRLAGGAGRLGGQGRRHWRLPAAGGLVRATGRAAGARGMTLTLIIEGTPYVTSDAASRQARDKAAERREVERFRHVRRMAETATGETLAAQAPIASHRQLRRDPVAGLVRDGRLRAEHGRAASEVKRVHEVISASIHGRVTATYGERLPRSPEDAGWPAPLLAAYRARYAPWQAWARTAGLHRRQRAAPETRANLAELTLLMAVDEWGHEQAARYFRMRRQSAIDRLRDSLDWYARHAGWIDESRLGPAAENSWLTARTVSA